MSSQAQQLNAQVSEEPVDEIFDIANDGCNYTMGNGNKMSIYYSMEYELLNIALQQRNNYYTILFFKGQDITDGIIWQSDGIASACTDVHGGGGQTESTKFPTKDYHQNISCSWYGIQEEPDQIFFTQRLMNTGDSQDMIIPFDEPVDLMFAFDTMGSNIDTFYRTMYTGDFQITISSETGAVTCANMIRFESDFWLTHGWGTWMAWSVLSLILIQSTRMGNIYYKFNYWTHFILGTLIVILTVFFCAVGYAKAGKIKPQNHAYIGTVMMGTSFLIAVGGYYAYHVSNTVKWNTGRGMFLKKIHKYFGYAIIILAQYEIQIGVLQYNEEWGKVWYIGYANYGFFFVSWAILELLYYRKKHWQLTDFKDPDIIMSNFELDTRIRQGEALIVLDDLILDVSEYQFYHPGGKFVIEQNIGRDISKFFYGGYAQETDQHALTQPPYNHSNIARIVINRLAIARLERKASRAMCKIGDEINDIRKVNSSTRTFTFRTFNKEIGWKNFFMDLAWIGRHYMIIDVKQPTLRRHYTTCNCMRRACYNELKRQANHFLKTGEIFKDFNWDILNTQDQSEMTVTIKNYNLPKGMSRQFFYEDKTYQIQGPMGRGVEMHHTGTHVAFTAGTGSLVFIDIVAHLLLKSMGMIKYVGGNKYNEEGDPLVTSSSESDSLEEDSISEDQNSDMQGTPKAMKKLEKKKAYEPDFKFMFFVSFRSVEDGVGLELCELLVKINEKLGLNNFELVKRISFNEKGERIKGNPRWDDKYLENQLDSIKAKGEQLKRVWVTGPPQLNEAYDKALFRLMPKYGLTQHDYDIM